MTSTSPDRVAALSARAGHAPGGLATTCTNCAAELAADARFCHACGEPVAARQDHSLRAVAQLLELQVTDLDSKLWRSFRLLYTRPGALTREYFAGRRTSFAKPLTLFVVLNVFFFLVQPHTGLLSWRLTEYVDVVPDARGRAADIAPGDDSRQADLVRRAMAKRGDTAGEFQARFDAEIQSHKKSMLLVMIPLFALALTGLRRLARRGEYFLEQLVFSVHAYAFFLVVLVLVTPLFIGALHAVAAAAPLLGAGATARVGRVLSGEPALVLVLAAVLASYLYAAIRRVYGDGRPWAAAQALALFVVLEALILGFRSALFYATLATL